MEQVPVDELRAHVAAAALRDDPLHGVLTVVDLDEGQASVDQETLRRLRQHPGLTVGRAHHPVDGPVTGVLDILVAGSGGPAPGPVGWVLVEDADAEVGRLAQAVGGAPLATRLLLDVLRHSPPDDVAAALVLESAAYSTLLAGPEFERWLRSRTPVPHRPGAQDPVRVEHAGDEVRVVLNRPHVHNAFDAATRERLTDALQALRDDPPARVVLAGEGPSFCSGGDLGQFGTAADPATAHVIRTARGPARLLAGLADLTVARVHGACVGAGVELAAFAGRVEAAAGATFRLPELAMGLIPGAGGTVSLPRRIGRQRTTWLAVSGSTLDAATALAWGLVDALGYDTDVR